MQTIILIAIVIAVSWALWRRARQAGGVAPAGVFFGRLADLTARGNQGALGPLIAALYSSLVDTSRRTWWTRRHHIDGRCWDVCACPQDAAILAPELPAVEDDLRAALRENASRHRIAVTGTLRLRQVISDDNVALGRPFLVPADVAAAPVRTPLVPRPARTNFGRRMDPPTTIAPTVADMTSTRRPDRAEPAVQIQLWPIGTPGGGPLTVPPEGLVLGRAPSLDAGRLPIPTISKRHAELRPEGADWVIRDLDSHNGTWVNGHRTERFKVAHGDVIGLGRHVRLRVIVGDGGLAPTVLATGPTEDNR